VAWQVGGLLGLERAYEFTRGRIPHETDIALLNAYRLLDLEWKHGLFFESRVERFFLQFHALMTAIDLFYILGHVFVTLGVLIWIMTKRNQHYARVRNLLMLTTAVALAVYYFFPTAPPRMLGNYGFVDMMQMHHLAQAGGEQPGSYSYNPYAAMPSLHVAYALVVTFALLLSERRFLVRLLAVSYPLVMAAVVIITGNHWLLDVIAAFVLVVLGAAILAAVSRIPALLAGQRLPLYRWVTLQKAAAERSS